MSNAPSSNPNTSYDLTDDEKLYFGNDAQKIQDALDGNVDKDTLEAAIRTVEGLINQASSAKDTVKEDALNLIKELLEKVTPTTIPPISTPTPAPAPTPTTPNTNEKSSRMKYVAGGAALLACAGLVAYRLQGQEGITNYTWEKRDENIGKDYTNAIGKELEGKGAKAALTIECKDGEMNEENPNNTFLHTGPEATKLAIINTGITIKGDNVISRSSDVIETNYGNAMHPWIVCEKAGEGESQWTVYLK